MQYAASGWRPGELWNFDANFRGLRNPSFNALTLSMLTSIKQPVRRSRFWRGQSPTNQILFSNRVPVQNDRHADGETLP